MIKNRIRTAALAGAIAVATGVSGLTVPAMAQEANVDGSVAVDVTAQNITEDELQELTNNVGEYLAGWQEGGSFQGIVGEYIALGSDGFDPSEEFAQTAFEQAREEAAAQLAQSAENITSARASVAHALEVDRAAEADWDAFSDSIDVAAAEINPLIEALNDANNNYGTDGEGTDYFYLLDELSTDVDGDPRPAPAYYELLELQAEVDRQYELAGQWAIDEDPVSYVSREHQAALDALKAAVDAQVETVEVAYDAAVEANREAQRSDVLVRQLYLERATAQRDTLRPIEAAFDVAARIVDLYEDDELISDGDSTLRAEYRAVLDEVLAGVFDNVYWLNEADEAASDRHNSWWTDRENGYEGVKYDEEKLEFATATYEAILANAVWQDALSRVQLIDQQIIDEREAERAAAEEAARQAEEAAEREQAIADALEEIANNNGGDNDDNDDDVNEGSSLEGSSVGGLGIFAALAGVIGLIAAAFPFVSNFLNR